MSTTYRVVFETETRPREAAISLDHVPPLQVDAPNVDIAARRALAEHIDTRASPSPAGTSFTLVVITPPPCAPRVPQHDSTTTRRCHVGVAYWPTTDTVH